MRKKEIKIKMKNKEEKVIKQIKKGNQIASIVDLLGIKQN
jgi:hypothetical protein